MNKIKLSSIIDRQVPEFIREEHPKFVSFLRTYYEYLETSGAIADIRSVKDVDNTLDAFVDSFVSEFAQNIPTSVLSERFLIQRVRDLYEAKGTNSSFELLFKLLFDKEVTVDYPSKQILRCSDGKWNQDRSIFVSVQAGSGLDLLGRKIRINTSSFPVESTVERVEEVKYIDDTGLTVNVAGQYELYLEKNIVTSGIEIGSVVLQNDISFVGKVLGVIKSIKVIAAGKNFRVGQLVPIQTASGQTSLIKVTAVNSVGGIVEAAMVKFGAGYLVDFTSTVAPSTISSSLVIPYAITGTSPSYSSTIKDGTNGFVDFGTISKTDYANDMWDAAYCGEVLSEFRTITSTEVVDATTLAIISLSLGSVARYPGYYSSNDGFLSDAMVLQDGKYFQTFSYVIRVTEKLESYKSMVKTLLHPAGMALFGEYELSNTINLDIFLEAIAQTANVGKRDSFSVIDQILVVLSKGYADSFAATDALTSVFSKALADASSASDIATLAMIKAAVDSVTSSDVAILTTSKVTVDSVNSIDALVSAMIKNLTDSVTATDLFGFNNTAFPTDSSTTSDAGFYQLNPYVELDYFSSDYVGTRVAF